MGIMVTSTEPDSELPGHPGQDFGLTGIERVTFAVVDLDVAIRFAADWGLTRAGGDGDSAAGFTAADGSGVELVRASPSGADRTPAGDASGLARITWGVRDASFLPAIARELARDRTVTTTADGAVASHDDLGFALTFQPTRRSLPAAAQTRYNSPGHASRVDERAVFYTQARPAEISHLAIAVDNAAQAARFYTERLGFRVTDRYADRALFLRCAPQGNHHNLFLMNGPRPGTRFGHLAFKVRDVHEVILGGQAFGAKGWKTFAGPGRHLVSSACFWYFHTPFGGQFEYAADEDMVTGQWQPQDFAAEAHIFTQWTFGLEKSDGTLRGPISESRAVADSTRA